jgi:DNA-binding HxlR family transcriptional regulator
MDSRRIYRHFCMLARTLEVAGDRWSLLIVRDLLLGPLRFTDLIRGLNEITPTRLTGRLRQLEAEGLVTREPPSTGREVWYRLTDAGRDLGPVVEALTLWGIEHRLEPPRPGEPVGAVPVMIGTKVWLSRNAQGRESPVSWVWHFAPDDRFSIWFDLQRAARRSRPAGGVYSDKSLWSLARGDSGAATVTITASPEAWARFLTTKRGKRQLPDEGIRLDGKPKAIKEFARAFAVDLRSP